MNPQFKKFIALFLVLSLVAINCITLKLPESKPRLKTPPELRQDIISFSKGTIKPGTRILVVQNSGAIVSGKFDGLALFSPEEYAENYADSREKNEGEIMLPALGENVIILNASGNKFECEFLGFDFGIIEAKHAGRAKPERTKLSEIKNVMDSSGNACEVETINKLISEGKIPFLSSGIIVKSKTGPAEIHWEEIYQIEVKKKGMPLSARLALVAVAVGVLYLAIDAVIKEIKQTEQEMEESCSMGAAYDSPVHPHIMIVRDLRDTYLMPSKLGRKLVNLYYKYSPFFARFIAKSDALKFVVRIGLLPIIAFSYSMVRLGPVITTAIIVSIFIFPVFFTLFFQRNLRRVKARQR
ncbi:MAG: hypothetical protein GTO16_07355 [Candidatus Aminicenantes bacterium]|nr:hypothetical protein [Candidatus Aminicenantes bacterium]